MATDSGFSNQKKKGLAQFETVHNLGSNTFGKQISQKSVYTKDSALSVNDITEVFGDDGQVKYWNIDCGGHTAVVGDVVRFSLSSSLPNFEFSVEVIPDGNNIQILPISEDMPIVGDSFDTLGWVTNRVSSDGDIAVAIVSAPTSYNYDGVPQTVEQDTATPANNRALPNLNFIIKDGVQVPVTKSTGTPSSTVAMPVEIVATTGTPINITAGDINIQTTDMGGSFDSMRIGDGSGRYIGVTVSNEAKTSDSTVATNTTNLNNAIAPEAGTQPSHGMVIAGHTGSGTVKHVLVDASGRPSVNVNTSALPTGAATAANQATEISSLSSIDTKLSSQATAALQGTGNTSLSSIDTKLSSQATASNQTAHSTLFGAVTETAPASDTASSGLNGRLQRIAQRITSLIALLPVSLGQKTMSGSLAVTLASDQSAVSTSQTALSASYQEVINLTTTAQTVTPPASAKWVKIYAEDGNAANIRVRLAGTATLTSGIQFQPGRSEDFSVVGTAISIIAESGTNQKINFTFGA